MSESQRVAAAITLLYDTYTPEGVGVWLKGRKRTLAGHTPLELLSEGRVDEFCHACERTAGMVAT